MPGRDTAALLAQIGRFGSKGLTAEPQAEQTALAWLADAAGTGLSRGYAVEALAWCHALPKLAAALTADVWWRLLDHVAHAVAEAERIALDDDPLLNQLLAGELALTTAYLFPEITGCRKLAPRARRSLSAGLVELLDGQGLMHGRHLELLRPLLACWTRCRAMGDRLSKGCWSEAAQTQYEWLVRHALRLTRCDGSAVFSEPPAGTWRPDLFAAALRLGGDADDADIATLALPGGSKTDASRISKTTLPPAAYHSEWAATAVLRAGWSRTDPQLVAVYHDRAVRMELSSRGHLLWSGVWRLEVQRDGQMVEPASPWQEVCWISDEDVDYLELEIELSGGVRVQRHFLLAREDRFLLLADAILGSTPARLQYRGCLPLCRGVSWESAEESWEGHLAEGRPAALVLPLALPEWRAGPPVGSLAVTADGLELCQTAKGCSMFAPLFFDLKPRRMTRRLTWRQLTVAEARQVQPHDVVVGYRVMVGKQQWLIYRSLREAGNRTLLGHNLSTEMLVARFRRDGEVETLLEIE